jgi:hypothetical protein
VFSSVVALTLSAHPGAAGLFQDRQADDWCGQQSWGDDRDGVCEIQEFTVPATGATLTVDATPNGGIAVEGTARGDVLVRARIVATARTKEEAHAIASRVQVTATADSVRADGPRGLTDRESWSVSYRIDAPAATPLSLKSTNGGLTIAGMNSRVEFRTVNGGVKLRSLAGNVSGRTTNGGIDVDLDGTTWSGDGLDVETSNGGVKMSIPAGYNAHLETGTVNGHISLDFPVSVQGEIRKSVSTDLGYGGPSLRVRTSNGGVKIQKK